MGLVSKCNAALDTSKKPGRRHGLISRAAGVLKDELQSTNSKHDAAPASKRALKPPAVPAKPAAPSATPATPVAPPAKPSAAPKPAEARALKPVTISETKSAAPFQFGAEKPAAVPVLKLEAPQKAAQRQATEWQAAQQATPQQAAQQQETAQQQQATTPPQATPRYLAAQPAIQQATPQDTAQQQETAQQQQATTPPQAGLQQEAAPPKEAEQAELLKQNNEAKEQDERGARAENQAEFSDRRGRRRSRPEFTEKHGENKAEKEEKDELKVEIKKEEDKTKDEKAAQDNGLNQFVDRRQRSKPEFDEKGEDKRKGERRVRGDGLNEFIDRRDRRRRSQSDEEFTERRNKASEEGDRRQRRRFVEGKNTLTVMNLRKSFGRKEIVRGVGFSMMGGRVAGLLGPNGAGKTTIFYMIVGFLKPTTGDIKLNNVSIIRGPMYRRARMGIAYLPQEASIFRKLTVEQNIWAILESRRDINKKQKKQKLNELIEEFSIGRIRRQLGYTLSGGERRRTEIARSLAIEPKFLLLDEPFAGIDPIAVFEIKQIIKRLADGGIGILITDHNVRDTLEITTDAFIINQGLIVARGDKNIILSNQTVRDVYLGSEFRM
jgi:lipopolysaccharide export system ATP-binding protein